MKNLYCCLIFVLILLTFSIQLSAQKDTVNYQVSISGIASTGLYSPFWFQSDQYGSVSIKPNSANFSIGAFKDFSHPNRLIDYGFKIDALLQTDNAKTNLYFHELYVKSRLLVFGLSIGMREEIYGNQDSTLSSGGLLFSRNSRPIPKIWAGIENFTAIPYTKGFLEVKGGISHGVFIDNILAENALLHHKYMYIRLGGKLPVKFQYGLEHVAQWGGFIPAYGQQPEGLSAFKTIFLGKSGGSDALVTDQINALGNHIISQGTKLEVQISDFRINAYWQNINEDNPIRVIWKSMNVSDGLWGISVKNDKFPFVKGILYEFLNTTDQSGPYHDKDGIVYGGTDTYLTNGVYQTGWTYFSRTIGTPFLSSPFYNTNGEKHIINTRVQAHHFGIEGEIYSFKYRALASFTKNYGSYYQAYNPMLRNNSFLFEMNKKIENLYDIEAGISLGADIGDFYGNSYGLKICLRKTGNLFKY